MHRTIAQLLISAAAGVGLAFTVPAIAHAGGGHDVTPGASCPTPGAHGTHHGDRYICQQKRTDQCPVWHHVPQPGVHGTPWSHGPCSKCAPVPTVSPTETPTPHPTRSHTLAPSPSRTTSPAGSVTTAGAPATTSVTTPPAQQGATTAGPAELPVTGNSLALAVLVGCALIAAGAVALIAGRRNNP